MLLIINNNTDPSYNLALEEYLLTSFAEPLCCLWRNQNAIIVGKNQNTISEINTEFVDKNNIPVIRRQTGGGAVFHDLGNINFTFIENDTTSFSDYSYFTKNIINFLATLGVTAYLEGRNDLMIDDKKISGNAQCIKKGRIMHHGTLLYNADLSFLTNALKVNKAKIESKGIKSIKSRVANIYDFLQIKMSVTQFKEKLEKYIVANNDCTIYELNGNDIANVNNLVKGKYGTYEWNYGFSPQYNFENQLRINSAFIEVKMQVDAGVIRSLQIFGDFFGKKQIGEIEQKLSGVNHQKNDVTAALKDFCIDDYISGATLREFLLVLF